MLRAKNIQNLKTEKEGIIILKSLVDGFMVPDTDQRRFLYEILNIDYKKYSRSIDGGHFAYFFISRSIIC